MPPHRGAFRSGLWYHRGLRPAGRSAERLRSAPSLEGPVMFQTRVVLGNTTVVAAFGAHTGLAKIESQHA